MWASNLSCFVRSTLCCKNSSLLSCVKERLGSWECSGARARAHTHTHTHTHRHTHTHTHTRVRVCYHLNFRNTPLIFVGQDSSVGIVTRYGLDDRGSNPGGGEIFRTRPDQPWGPPGLLHNVYGVISGGKSARAWRWPPSLTSSAKAKERVEIYINSHSGASWPILWWTSALTAQIFTKRGMEFC